MCMTRKLTVTSGEFREKTGLQICTDHTGKMHGFWSLSISPLNELCEKKAQIEGSICHECYSRHMQEMYCDLSKCLEQNMEILTKRILGEDEMPNINNKLKMFRYESFGDIISEIQVVNDFHITEANPGIACAMWTKNPWIVKSAMEHYGLKKPVNLTIIGSSYFLNEPMTEYYRNFDFIDYIFTVYTKDYIAENGVEINCGGRSCRDCRRCYLRTHDGYEIREILK